MPLGLDLLLVLSGLAIAMLVAAIAGGLLGRRIRDAIDGRRAARSAGGPVDDAGAGAVARADARSAAAAPGTALPVRRFPAATDASPGPAWPGARATPEIDRSLLVDPDRVRRLAGLPPPVATRVPEAMSPAMRERGGVPITGGRPVDPRVAAAPFVLAGPTRPATAVAPRPEPAPPPARAAPSPGRTHRRLGIVLSAAAALVLAVWFGMWLGGPRGAVLDALGTPAATAATPSPTPSPTPGATP